ncbi:MAG: hypothetical protein U1E83_06500 [Methylotetracoccus sp.]
MRQVITILAAACLAAPSLCAAVDFKNIKLRYTAAVYTYEEENLPPEQSDLKSLQIWAGFDVAFDTYFYNDGKDYYMGDYGLYGGTPPQVLTASGAVQFHTDTGANDCSAVFKVHPGAVPRIDSDGLIQDGPYKTILISTPTRMSNTGTDAFLDNPDGVIGPFGYCRVARSMLFVTGATIDEDHIPADWSPKVDVSPWDDSKLSGAVKRMGTAIFKFDVRALPVVIPLSYRWTESGPNGSKSFIWFGRVEVFENTGQALAPINPFTLGNYTPPRPGQKPALPPKNVKPEVIPGIAQWVRDNLIPLVQPVRDIGFDWQRLISGQGAFSATLANGATAEFDATGPVLRISNVLPAPKTGGKVAWHAAFVDPDAADSYVPKIPPGTPEFRVAAGKANGFTLRLDKDAQQALQSGQARTVFLIGRLRPNGGGKPSLQVVKFNLKARE